MGLALSALILSCASGGAWAEQKLQCTLGEREPVIQSGCGSNYTRVLVGTETPYNERHVADVYAPKTECLCTDETPVPHLLTGAEITKIHPADACHDIGIEVALSGKGTPGKIGGYIMQVRPQGEKYEIASAHEVEVNIGALPYSINYRHEDPLPYDFWHDRYVTYSNSWDGSRWHDFDPDKPFQVSYGVYIAGQNTIFWDRKLISSCKEGKIIGVCLEDDSYGTSTNGCDKGYRFEPKTDGTDGGTCLCDPSQQGTDPTPVNPTPTGSMRVEKVEFTGEVVCSEKECTSSTDNRYPVNIQTSGASDKNATFCVHWEAGQDGGLYDEDGKWGLTSQENTPPEFRLSYYSSLVGVPYTISYFIAKDSSNPCDTDWWKKVDGSVAKVRATLQNGKLVSQDIGADDELESVRIVTVESDSGTLITRDTWKYEAPAEVDDCSGSSCNHDSRISYCRRLAVEPVDAAGTIVKEIVEGKGSAKNAKFTTKEHWFEGLVKGLDKNKPYKLTYSVGALHNVDEKGASFCKSTLATWLPGAVSDTRHAFKGKLYASMVELLEGAQQATGMDAKADFERLYGGTDYRFLSENVSSATVRLSRDSSVSDEVFESERAEGEESIFRFTIPVNRFFGKGGAPQGEIGIRVFLKLPKDAGGLKTVVKGYAVNGQWYDDGDEHDLHHVENGIYSMTLNLGEGKGNLNLPQTPCKNGFDTDQSCTTSNTVEIRLGRVLDASGNGLASTPSAYFAMLDTGDVDYPVILLHGHKTPAGLSGTVGDVSGIANYLERESVLHVRQSLLGGAADTFAAQGGRNFTWEINFGWDSDSMLGEQAMRLNDVIEKVQKQFGVNKVNIIAYGKAGVDARMYLRKYKQTALDAIDTMVQVEPPNHGQGFPYVPDVASMSEQVKDWEEVLKSVNSASECDSTLYLGDLVLKDPDAVEGRAKCRAYSNASAGRMEITPAFMRTFNYKEKFEDRTFPKQNRWIFTPEYSDYEEGADIRVVVGGAWKAWAEDLLQKRKERQNALNATHETVMEESFKILLDLGLDKVLNAIEPWAVGGSHRFSEVAKEFGKNFNASDADVITNLAAVPAGLCSAVDDALDGKGSGFLGTGCTWEFNPVSMDEWYNVAETGFSTMLGLCAEKAWGEAGGYLKISYNMLKALGASLEAWVKVGEAHFAYSKTAAKSNIYGVPHQSATLPWHVGCNAKTDVNIEECSKNELVVYDYGGMDNAHTTWPYIEWVNVEKTLPSAASNLSLLKDAHYGVVRNQLRYPSGLSYLALGSGKSAPAKSATLKDILKNGAGDDNHPGWGSYEPVYQNFFGTTAGAGGHSFVLQAGVPVVVTVYVLGAPNATAVVKSPSGAETPITNASTESFLGQLALMPDASGAWSVRVQGVDTNMYVVRVGRERTPTIAMGALATHKLVAPGGETELVGWLYDPTQSNNVDFAQLPQTARGSYSTLAMQAVVQNPDGSLEYVPMSDGGDGFYKGTFKPSVQDGKLLVRVASLRDGVIQLMNEEALEITVSQAAASEILTLSAPTETKDAEGLIERVQYTVTANLAQAGEYVMAAAIGVQSGECDAEGCTHLTNLRSSTVTASAPGEYAFTIELERDFVARHKDNMPFNFNTADLFFVNHGREELMASKVFNEPIPYDDASKFIKPATQFLGLQGDVVLRDTDGDGKPDQAVVRYRVNTPTAGQYTLQAALSSGDATLLGSGEFQRGAGAFDAEITFNNICRLKETGASEFVLSGIEAYGPAVGADRGRYPITLDLSTVDACTSKLPDLQVAGSGGGDLQFTKARVVSGGVSISNTGSQGAETVVWTARLGSSTGKLLDAGVIDSLAAGASADIAVAAPEADVPEGTKVCVAVNPGHDIAERDYSNNEKCFVVKAGGAGGSGGGAAGTGGAAPVPTMSEIGLLLSGIALAGAAAPALRRRREREEQRKRA